MSQPWVKAFKVRVGFDYRATLRLAGIRRLAGDDVQIMVDGSRALHGAYCTGDCQRPNDLNVLFFEEPIPVSHRENESARCRVPGSNCIWRALLHGSRFQDCFIHRRADIAQPDAATCGGILEAVQARCVSVLFRWCCTPVPARSHSPPASIWQRL